MPHLMGDDYLELPPVGGGLRDMVVCASGPALQPPRSETDGFEAIPGVNAAATGGRAYWLTGVAGPAVATLREEGARPGAMFVLSVAGQPVLASVLAQEPGSIEVGARVTSECRLGVLDGYETGQLDDLLDPMADWRVVEECRLGRRRDGLGYVLDLEPVPAQLDVVNGRL